MPHFKFRGSYLHFVQFFNDILRIWKAENGCNTPVLILPKLDMDIK